VVDWFRKGIFKTEMLAGHSGTLERLKQDSEFEPAWATKQDPISKREINYKN
jgi:hypothetical protein